MSQRVLEEERHRSEAALFESKFKMLEESLRVKTHDFELAQIEIKQLREAGHKFEIQI